MVAEVLQEAAIAVEDIAAAVTVAAVTVAVAVVHQAVVDKQLKIDIKRKRYEEDSYYNPHGIGGYKQLCAVCL